MTDQAVSDDGMERPPDSCAQGMRILHLIASFGEGGAERQLSLLGPALTARGIDCHIAYNEGGTHLARAENSDVVLHRLPKRGNAHPARITDLVRLIREVRPHIVQTWLMQMDVVGAIAAKICGIPYILSERASSAAYPVHWKNRLRSLLGRQAAIIIANSSTGALYWTEQGATRPIMIIPNALVADDRSAVPHEAATLPASKILLTAGRFSEEKNIDGAIDGLDLALDALPDHQAIVFGDGHLRDAIRMQASQTRNASRIHLPGFSDHLAYWRKRADVFVSVSHQEGHPNVVLEAASEGCPLVISDIPGHRGCLSEKAAIWVDKDSPPAIAAGIVKAAMDRPMANAMASAALSDVSRFTLRSQVDLYCQTYAALLKKNGKSSVTAVETKGRPL